MKHIVEKIWCFLKNLCRCPVKNKIILGFGQHEIKLNEKPCRISLSIKTPCDCIPVCQGDLNKFKILVQNGEFIVQADIKTNICILEWVCY